MDANCLILKASGDACGSEVGSLQANIASVDKSAVVEIVEWLSPSDFAPQVKDKKFRIIYLAAHADGEGFGEANFPTWSKWEQLATVICITDCIVPGGILFMGCCRGGMKTVALKIFKTCQKIDYVVGPNHNSREGDLVTAFTAFIRNLNKGSSPGVAAERASGATGEIFHCHDRQELEIDLILSQKIDQISEQIGFLTEYIRNIAEKLEVPAPAPKFSDDFDLIVSIVRPNPGEASDKTEESPPTIPT